jgi:hypothetical protein
MINHFIQRLDYHANPVFNMHPSSVFTDQDNLMIYGLISKIDCSVTLCMNEENYFLRFLLKKEIKSLIGKIKVLIHSRTQEGDLLRKSLTICLEEAERYVFHYLNLSLAPSFNVNLNKETIFNKEKYADLLKNGYCEYLIPTTEKFSKLCSKQMEEARGKYKEKENWRGANWEGFNQTELYKLLKEFILDNHIVDLVSAYKGKEMDFKYLAWDYNHHRQSWFKKINGVEKDSPTNYYHFDAEPEVAKMMIYLSDVNMEDGPFRFVAGSNNLQRSLFMIGLHLGVDKKVNALVEGVPGLYNRNAFTYRRDLLMQFPKAFLGSTHFGDDLVEGSDLSDYLLKNTVTFLGAAGKCIVFDRYLGVHAGGNPKSGERLAVQVGFIQKKRK